MTLEDFARANNLPDKWLDLRHECEGIVRDPQFWYQPGLQNDARTLAVQASDILHHAIANSSLPSQVDTDSHSTGS